MRTAAVLLTMVWAVACAGRAAAPPAIVVDRSACSRCGMLISERAYAAAIRQPDGRDRLFDDIGCLVATVREHPAGTGHYWFHDAIDGEWIVPESPVFVASPELRTPMGGGIAAYRGRADAERAATRLRGRVIGDVPGLVALEGSSR